MTQALGEKAAWQWVLGDRLLSHVVGLLSHETDCIHVWFFVKLSTWLQGVAGLCSCPQFVVPRERRDSSGPTEDGCRKIRARERRLPGSWDPAEDEDHVTNGEEQGWGTLALDLVVFIERNS